MAELDRHGVTRAAVMASVPGDEPSVAEAVARHPARLTGTFMLNPTAPDASARVRQGFGERGLRCACLFPAMHGSCSTTNGSSGVRGCGRAPVRGVRALRRPVGRRPAQAGSAVTVRHPAREPARPRPDRVSVPRCAGRRSPLRRRFLPRDPHGGRPLPKPPRRYVKFERLDEVHARPAPRDVFRQALAVLGPERMLFGSDSSFFPRGWQHTVLDAQRAALDEIALDAESRAAIFASNFNRVFGGGTSPPGNAG